MDLRIKVLLLLSIIVLNIALVWFHLNIETDKKLKNFNSQQELQEWVAKFLINEGFTNSTIRFTKTSTGFQRNQASIDYDPTIQSVADVNFSLQKHLRDYDMQLHGRVDLINQVSSLHILANSTVLLSLNFQPISADQ